MFCPQCHAEYRQGFTRCSDCDVDLVWELPAEAIVPHASVEPGDPDEDPYCTFWRGDDPRLHAELCAILDEAGIPHKTVRRADHLFNLASKSALQIGVPFSLYARAEAAVGEAYGTDENVRNEGGNSQRVLPESVGPNVEREDRDAEPWFPEDATAEIWSGDQAEMREILDAALRENGIRARAEARNGKQKLFVLPQEEARAREIVREVVEASPPE